jgi:Fe2+ or Zn2+ uptake regulation protein
MIKLARTYVLGKKADDEFTAEQVAEATGDILTNVRTVLTKMRTAGVIHVARRDGKQLVYSLTPSKTAIQCVCCGAKGHQLFTSGTLAVMLCEKHITLATNLAG